ncbi:MAG: hypothetical protein ACLUL2_28595 [Blautia sp.]
MRRRHPRIGEKELEELSAETEKRAVKRLKETTAEAGKIGETKKTACLLKPEKCFGIRR